MCRVLAWFHSVVCLNYLSIYIKEEDDSQRAVQVGLGKMEKKRIYFWKSCLNQVYTKHVTDKYKGSDRCFVLVCQMLCISLTDALPRLTDVLGYLSDAWWDASQAVVNCLTRSTKQMASVWRKLWFIWSISYLCEILHIFQYKMLTLSVSYKIPVSVFIGCYLTREYTIF